MDPVRSTCPTQGDYAVTAYAYDTVGPAGPVDSGATARYPSTRATCRRPSRRPAGSRRRAPPSPTARSSSAAGSRTTSRSPRLRSAIVERPRAVHELVRHVHQHDRELPHGVPEQPRLARVELLLHDPGHPGRELHGPRPRRSTSTASRRPCPARRNVTVTGTPTNLPPVANFTFTCVAERVHVRRPHVDRRERADADVLVELRPGLRLGPGARPRRTPAPGTFTVTLTVRTSTACTATTSLNGHDRRAAGQRWRRSR